MVGNDRKPTDYEARLDFLKFDICTAAISKTMRIVPCLFINVIVLHNYYPTICAPTKKKMLL